MNTPFRPFQPVVTYLLPQMCTIFARPKGETVWEVFGEGPFTYTSVPAPEMQRLAKMLVGKWRVDEDFAPGGTMPSGGRGSGRSVSGEQSKPRSTTGIGGIKDWNSSLALLYGNQTGSPDEFGFPVFANWGQ